jgi:hypothetical protein
LRKSYSYNHSIYRENDDYDSRFSTRFTKKRSEADFVVSAKNHRGVIASAQCPAIVDDSYHQSVGQPLRDHTAYKFPKYSKEEQIEKLLGRTKDRNIKDPFTGEVSSATFYENVEKADFLNYLLKRYHLYMASPQSKHVQVLRKVVQGLFHKAGAYPDGIAMCLRVDNWNNTQVWRILGPEIPRPRISPAG